MDDSRRELDRIIERIKEARALGLVGHAALDHLGVKVAGVDEQITHRVAAASR